MDKIPLSQAITQAGTSGRKLAAALDLPYISLTKYAAGTIPNVLVAIRIADALALDVQQIDWGHKATKD